MAPAWAAGRAGAEREESTVREARRVSIPYCEMSHGCYQLDYIRDEHKESNRPCLQGWL